MFCTSVNYSYEVKNTVQDMLIFHNFNTSFAFCFQLE